MYAYFYFLKMIKLGNSMVVQWLGLHAVTVLGLSSIPGQETKVPEVARSK